MRIILLALFLIISCANAPIKAEEELELPEQIRELLKEEPRFSPGDRVVAVLRIVSGGDESVVIGYVFPDKFIIGTVDEIKEKLVCVDWGNGKIIEMSPENLAHYKPKPTGE